MENRDALREVAEMALGAFDRAPRKLLVYAEVEDGVASADLFAEFDRANSVTFRFAPVMLREAIYAFWDSGDALVKPRSWATFKMVVEDSRFNLDFVYPADLADGEDLSDRRPRVVAEVFPGRAVDYSNPRRG